MRLNLFTKKDIDKIHYGLEQGILNGMKMRIKHPVLFWVTIAFLLAILLFPLIAFYAWLNQKGYQAFQGLPGGILAILSVIASLVVGIALGNECMRIVDGYLGWKVTILCLLLGGGGRLLCAWLMPMVAV